VSPPRVLFAAWLLGAVLSAQGPGTVRFDRKVSHTAGGPNRPVLDDGDQFGRSITRVGDLDGNGFADLAVGAHGDDDGGADVGAVWIFRMGAGPSILARQKISLLAGGFAGQLDPVDGFGRAIGALGDLDGDGIPDLAIGANEDDDGGTNRGAVYVCFLNADGTVRAHQKISSTAGGFAGPLDNQDQFGRSIAGLGDLDGDGVRDMAVGAIYDDDGVSNAGAVWVLFLRADGTVKASQKISLTQGGFTYPLTVQSAFGMSVANLGDVNGDGVVDLGVGAIGGSVGAFQSGAVHVLLLRTDGTVASCRVINGTREGGLLHELDQYDQFGFSVGSLGDVDGDTVPDLVSGAITDDDVVQAGGAVYVVFLNLDGSHKGHQKINAVNGGFTRELDAFDWFGSACGGLGDLDGDGNPDLGVGARFDDDGGLNRGAVYLLFLNARSSVPVAELTGSPRSGDAPLTVAFTDLSTGVVTDRSWDFGDGGSSTESDPSHTYLTPGTYTVSLSVSGPTGSDARTAIDYVTVDDPTIAPVADFVGSPLAGPAPLQIDLTDLTTGSVSAWSWDFGDGSSSALQSPSHTYASAGTYTVSLTASGPGGSDTKTAVDYVAVAEPAPVVDFEGSPLSGDLPLSVDFTDRSAGTVTAWSWDFGDGGSSALQNPSHIYASAGTYAVSLTASGPGGSDTKSVAGYVTVHDPAVAPVADFVGSPLAGPAPLQVVFTDLSTGSVTGWSWDFGDGGSSTQQNPAHTYASAGTYTVSLTTSGPGGSDTRTVVDYVTVTDPAPAADFAGSPLSGVAPLAVAFTDLSAGAITTRAWTFGDGAGSMEQHPSHAYASAGTYTVSLTVTGPGGSDTKTAVDYVTVGEPAPTAEFTASPTAGPAPLSVAFTDLSTGVVDAWSWDFGDGSSSSERHPVHVYAATGTYAVSLTASGPGGSTTETKPDMIAVSATAPKAAFDASPTSGFAPLSVAFTDLSTGAIDAWSWDFGDGQVSSEASPTHAYASRGDHLAQLTVTGPGGSSSASTTIEVTLDPMTGIVEYGCGTNPDGSLVVVQGPAVPGEPLGLGVDNPLGTQGVGSIPVLYGAVAPAAGFPCGPLISGLGMAGSGSPGELLLALSPPPVVRVVGSPWGGVGVPSEFGFVVPPDAGLVGATVYFQALLIDPRPGARVRVGLTIGLAVEIQPG